MKPSSYQVKQGRLGVVKYVHNEDGQKQAEKISDETRVEIKLKRKDPFVGQKSSGVTKKPSSTVTFFPP